MDDGLVGVIEPVEPQQKHSDQILQRQIAPRKLVFILENAFVNGGVGVFHEFVFLLDFGDADGIEFVNDLYIELQHLFHGISGKGNQPTAGTRFKLKTMNDRLGNRNDGGFFHREMLVVGDELQFSALEDKNLKKLAVRMRFYGVTRFTEHLVERNNVDDFAHQFNVLLLVDAVVENLLRHFTKIRKIWKYF